MTARLARTILGLGLLVVGAACAEGKDSALADGARDYARHCASCHGQSGRGAGPVAPYLASAPSDLTLIAWRNEGVFPTDQVAFIIDGRGDVLAHGPRDMPVWGEILGPTPGGRDPDLARRRIKALTEYLRSIQRTPE